MFYFNYPGLLALRIEREAGRDLVEFLRHEDELERGTVGALDVAVFLCHGFLELLEEVLADDIDDPAETGLYGVVDGIVDDGLAIGAQSVHLLEAAIAAAHACGEDEKSRFHAEIVLDSMQK